MGDIKEYADGRPLDRVRYLEYKILLKPDHFVRPEGFQYYWDIVSNVANELGVKISPTKEPFHRSVREVLFFDTPKFKLYNNSYILRKRTFIVDGWPEIDHEMAFKYRHPDLLTAAQVDVRANIPGRERIKFKEEILPLKDRIGGMRSLFSHNCVLSSPNITLDEGLKNIIQVFPCLQEVYACSESKLSLVNQMNVIEVQVTPGYLHFGHGIKAKATIAIWRERTKEASLVGEFSFQYKFEKIDDVHPKSRKLSDNFFVALQEKAPQWIELGTTKTYIVYGMGKKKKVSNTE